MKTQTAYQKIRAGMIRCEREVFSHIRLNSPVPLFGFGAGWGRWRNARERLEAKGRIRYSKRLGGWVTQTNRK